MSDLDDVVNWNASYWVIDDSEDSARKELNQLRADLEKAQRHAERWRAFAEKQNETLKEARETIVNIAGEGITIALNKYSGVDAVIMRKLARAWLSAHPSASENAEADK